MNKTTLTLVISLLTGSGFVTTAQADQWQVGAAALMATSPYVGGKDQVWPVPVINYESQRFYLRTTALGYNLWKDSENELSVTAFYYGQHFRPGDTDNSLLKKLDKRHSTLMAGLSYRWQSAQGLFRTTLAGDVLDNSNGLLWDLAYHYPVQLGRIVLAPGIGATWSSSNFNRYYYGISSTEAARSGLAVSRPDDGWAPYGELTAKYAFSPQWQSWLSGRYTRLPGTVTDSPMIADKGFTMIMGGVTYTF